MIGEEDKFCDMPSLHDGKPVSSTSFSKRELSSNSVSQTDDRYVVRVRCEGVFLTIHGKEIDSDSYCCCSPNVAPFHPQP
jgi:hypothetical protein